MSKYATKAAGNMFCQARYEAAKFNERLSSREGAAEELGVDRTRLARIELGSVIPYPEEVLLMADIYRAPELKGKGWNGKKQYIQLASGISYKSPTGDIVNCEHDAIGNMAVAFVGTSGVQMGWLASQADMLAEDWVFA